VLLERAGIVAQGAVEEDDTRLLGTELRLRGLVDPAVANRDARLARPRAHALPQLGCALARHEPLSRLADRKPCLLRLRQPHALVLRAEPVRVTPKDRSRALLGRLTPEHHCAARNGVACRAREVGVCNRHGLEAEDVLSVVL